MCEKPKKETHGGPRTVSRTHIAVAVQGERIWQSEDKESRWQNLPEQYTNGTQKGVLLEHSRHLLLPKNSSVIVLYRFARGEGVPGCALRKKMDTEAIHEEIQGLRTPAYKQSIIGLIQLAPYDMECRVVSLTINNYSGIHASPVPIDPIFWGLHSLSPTVGDNPTAQRALRVVCHVFFPARK
jgi:hypothetical protein